MRSSVLCASVAALALLAIGPSAAVAQSHDGNDRHVVVINHSSQSIWRFYASRTDTDSWEEDILGSHTIPSWTARTINIDDGTGACYYDFKAVMRDGTSVIKNDVDVCVLETWTITD